MVSPGQGVFIGAARRISKDGHGLRRIIAHGGFAGQHDGGSAADHGKSDIRHLSAGGRGCVDHGVQHLGDDQEGTAALAAAAAGFIVSGYLLLWNPRDKKLWYLDIEHEEFHPLAKWDDFIADPGRYLNGMIEGEFEE